jgi:hypothetical protein
MGNVAASSSAAFCQGRPKSSQAGHGRRACACPRSASRAAKHKVTAAHRPTAATPSTPTAVVGRSCLQRQRARSAVHY